jgi:hypothetical protein
MVATKDKSIVQSILKDHTSEFLTLDHIFWLEIGFFLIGDWIFFFDWTRINTDWTRIFPAFTYKNPC